LVRSASVIVPAAATCSGVAAPRARAWITSSYASVNGPISFQNTANQIRYDASLPDVHGFSSAVIVCCRYALMNVRYDSSVQFASSLLPVEPLSPA
jgi:hypothetical protein